MQYVQQLEQKYGTTDFSRVLASMSEKEYQTFHQLESASPMWDNANQYGYSSVANSYKHGIISTGIDPKIESIFADLPSEINAKAEYINNALDNFSSRKSLWKHKLSIFESKTNPSSYGYKDRTCSISISNDAGTHTLIHELLHARSYSYYDLADYIYWKPFEEGTVELYSRTICEKAGIPYLNESYNNVVDNLISIANRLKYDDVFQFAQDLFETPLPERYNWLNSITNSRKILMDDEDYLFVQTMIEGIKNAKV